MAYQCSECKEECKQVYSNREDWLCEECLEDLELE